MAPDDDVLRCISTTYSTNHANMFTGHHCGMTFPGGIVNGAQLHTVGGGMQDYNYVWVRCLDITLEQTCCFRHRYNANGVDLNRNFPDALDEAHSPVIQNETQAVMNWLHDHQFVLSGSLHGGALVANYAYDNLPPKFQDIPHENLTADEQYSRSPDGDIFRHISLVYAQNHPKMHQANACPGSTFSDGITNGAAWYKLKATIFLFIPLIKVLPLCLQRPTLSAFPVFLTPSEKRLSLSTTAPYKEGQITPLPPHLGGQCPRLSPSLKDSYR
ncbi:hypothetical protein scyTo_0004821 [Scyliorhinus torazame]|uniref:Peptidase M14 domain-containing protein n=1 Tax=Scyliorhinus torazame TaxID=75743 RepID=A0A401NXL5_SCYTO|nr:hypothetical protein [Scyliorhinus torazame]